MVLSAWISGEAIYSSVFEAAPSMQNLFKTPRPQATECHGCWNVWPSLWNHDQVCHGLAFHEWRGAQNATCNGYDFYMILKLILETWNKPLIISIYTGQSYTYIQYIYIACSVQQRGMELSRERRLIKLEGNDRVQQISRSNITK